MVSRDGIIAVYMMASGMRGTIYIGVTSNLVRRVYEHREGLISGFTSAYGCKLLVWYELWDRISGAIQREKSLKRWPRAWKCNLIERENLLWEDLYPALTGMVVAPGPLSALPPLPPSS